MPTSVTCRNVIAKRVRSLTGIYIYIYLYTKITVWCEDICKCGRGVYLGIKCSMLNVTSRQQ